MDKKRIQVYANEEMKRRIELAAAKHNLAVTEYCLTAIQQQLADDDFLEAQQLVVPVKAIRDATLITDLVALQARIKARRGGKPIDLEHIVEDLHAERDYELTGLP